MVNKIPRILISPLNWGMGHATRCVPVIRELQKHKAEVLVGADGKAFAFLKDYFPELEIFRLPDLKISYPRNGSLALHMMLRAPEIIQSAWKEHQILAKLVRERNITGVISDNRFGLWSRHAYSVYITHQVRIKGPRGWGFTEPVLSGIHRRFWENYDECWIPDYPGVDNLSGALGHPRRPSLNCFYVGPLSRFSLDEKNKLNEEPGGPDLLVLLSGPEPQRGLFEQIILHSLKNFPGTRTVIVRGLPEQTETSSPLPHVTLFSHLPDVEMSRLMQTAGTIICRPGYSTLMDLASLGKNAVLVPTPGQTEQEYLAYLHTKRNTFCSLAQDEFDLAKALLMAKDLVTPEKPTPSQMLLAERVSNFIARLTSPK